MKVFAVANEIPERCDYLTANKEYEVRGEDRAQPADFFFTDDKGEERHCFWNSSWHLGGDNWQRVEREE